MGNLHKQLAHDMFRVAIHALVEMNCNPEDIYDGGIEALRELYPPSPPEDKGNAAQESG